MTVSLDICVIPCKPFGVVQLWVRLCVGFGLWSACISASQVALLVKNLSANAADERDAGSIPGL